MSRSRSVWLKAAMASVGTASRTNPFYPMANPAPGMKVNPVIPIYLKAGMGAIISSSRVITIKGLPGICLNFHRF